MTHDDHRKLAELMKYLLEMADKGTLDRDGFGSQMVQAIAALDIGNMSEFRYHLERPDDYFSRK